MPARLRPVECPDGGQQRRDGFPKGMCLGSTLTPGWAASNRRAMRDDLFPSSPMAHHGNGDSAGADRTETAGGTANAARAGSTTSELIG